MNLQDRAYALGIFIVLGICCIGAYVAVSGFMNANPQGLSLGLGGQTPAPTVQSADVTVPTETESAATATAVPVLTAAPPTNTPKGIKPTLTPLSRGTPSPAFLADIPTITPGAAGTIPAPGVAPSPTAAGAGNCGSPFCFRRFGPPSDEAPTGNPCPINYIWGFVYDTNGRGLAGMRIKYQNPDGGVDKTTTKDAPDPVGRYDIVAGGGMWTVQLIDQNGNPLSPVISFEAHKAYTSGNSCPTRLDFVKQ